MRIDVTKGTRRDAVLHGMGSRFATVALPGPVRRNPGPTEPPREQLQDVRERFRDPKVDLKWTSGIQKIGFRGSKVSFQMVFQRCEV